ncbi:hypothetical protein [Aquimarina algiphila]|uniref:Uncharacterized protein n=1 Tax=Aquimarina algiphila TaxID=2047982 RepID=A0A554VRK3_9FLAO|nr:hypothetical protein [Aquimarina algiphila]TSE11293.1 hypothetical protein FOF46_01295 [Aquimarina algiphila]
MRVEDFEKDDNVTINDFVLGTDAEQTNQTKNFAIRDIIALASEGIDLTADGTGGVILDGNNIEIGGTTAQDTTLAIGAGNTFRIEGRGAKAMQLFSISTSGILLEDGATANKNSINVDVTGIKINSHFIGTPVAGNVLSFIDATGTIGQSTPSSGSGGDIVILNSYASLPSNGDSSKIYLIQDPNEDYEAFYHFDSGIGEYTSISNGKTQNSVEILFEDYFYEIVGTTGQFRVAREGDGTAANFGELEISSGANNGVSLKGGTLFLQGGGSLISEGASITMSQTGAILRDNTNTGGLRYASDYSSNYTDRSLVDRAFVTGLSGVASEGVWTAELLDFGGGATYAFTQSATYYRIGKLVYLELLISSITTTNIPTGILAIQGMPFEVSGDGTVIVTDFRAASPSVDFDIIKGVFVRSGGTTDQFRFQIKPANSGLPQTGRNYAAITFSGSDQRIQLSATYLTND